jgi:hypothetical protein
VRDAEAVDDAVQHMQRHVEHTVGRSVTRPHRVLRRVTCGQFFTALSELHCEERTTTMRPSARNQRCHGTGRSLVCRCSSGRTSSASRSRNTRLPVPPPHAVRYERRDQGHRRSDGCTHLAATSSNAQLAAPVLCIAPAVSSVWRATQYRRQNVPGDRQAMRPAHACTPAPCPTSIPCEQGYGQGSRASVSSSYPQRCARRPAQD